MRVASFCILFTVAVTAPVMAQTTVPLAGTARDVSLTANGKLLVVTSQGHVLEIEPSGAVVSLAAPGEFARPLIAGVSLAPGLAAVLDDEGSIHEVGAVPGAPLEIYDDLYIVREPTDLVLDENGNYWIFCKTVSNITWGVAHVSADGQRWGYYDVTRSPVAGAHDPVTGALLMTDAIGAIVLLAADADGAPVTSVLGSASGFSLTTFDGDVAVATNGDVYYAAGTTLKRVDRATLVTTNFATFGSTVRGVTFGPASSGVGESLWIVEGAPSTLREVLTGATGGPRLGPAIAEVPGTGPQVISYGVNANEAIVDRDGHLLIGGDTFGSNVRVDRVSLPNLSLTNIATGAMGLTSRIEGLEIDEDGRIFALTRFGVLHTIDEGVGPATVGTFFSDPFDQIVIAKDLARARNGDFYLSERKGWNIGTVSRISAAGNLSTVISLNESRGVLADPFGARLLSNEWNNTGFNCVVGVVNELNGTLDDLPGFFGLNLSNQENFGDGDMVMDVTGRIYTSAEDEFSVVVWNPKTQRKKRFASGYLSRPGGLAIARSSALNPYSSTGWSLYVAQWTRMNEIPGVAPAAPRALDRDAPGIGEVLSFGRPEWGRPVAFVHEPWLQALVAVTDEVHVVAFPLDGSAPSVLADTGAGLAGELVAIAARGNGDLLVGTQSGEVYTLDASLGFTASLLFDDPLDQIAELTDLVHDDGVGTYLLAAAPTALDVGPLWHLDGGVLTQVAAPWNGAALALDPVTGNPFVSQAATPTSPGELLRIHTGLSPARANHWPSKSYRSFALHGETKGLAFDGDGRLYVACDATARIEVVDRATQNVTLKAGNYDGPSDLVVAPGRVGVAGAMGASLFVLDGYSIFEHGIPGPAPTGPITPTVESDPFMVPALFQFGGGNDLLLTSPADAGLPLIVLPGFGGQSNPLPLALAGGDFFDTRTIAQDFDLYWFNAITGAFPFVGFFNAFDGSGVPVAPITLDLPNIPAYTGLGALIDLTWVSLDPFAPNGVATVGGTSQIRVGL